jgi:hypothetical protein
MTTTETKLKYVFSAENSQSKMKMMTKTRRPTIILQMCFLVDSFVCCALVIGYVHEDGRLAATKMIPSWFSATSEGKSQKRSTIN